MFYKMFSSGLFLVSFSGTPYIFGISENRCWSMFKILHNLDDIEICPQNVYDFSN